MIRGLKVSRRWLYFRFHVGIHSFPLINELKRRDRDSQRLCPVCETPYLEVKARIQAKTFRPRPLSLGCFNGIFPINASNGWNFFFSSNRSPHLISISERKSSRGQRQRGSRPWIGISLLFLTSGRIERRDLTFFFSRLRTREAQALAYLFCLSEESDQGEGLEER